MIDKTSDDRPPHRVAESSSPPKLHASSGVVAETTTEVVITLFPLTILFFATHQKRGFAELLAHHEWMFIAAVLFTQSIVRLMRVLREKRAHRQRLELLVVALITFGVFPCAMAAVREPLSDDEAGNSVTLNIVAFSAAVASFYWSAALQARLSLK